MSQVTEQSVRFQTALASIKLIQASAVLDLTEDDFDFLTSNKVWIATDRSRARRCVEACVYGTLDFRSEERFSRNAETDLVCRLLPEKKTYPPPTPTPHPFRRRYSHLGTEQPSLTPRSRVFYRSHPVPAKLASTQAPSVPNVKINHLL